MSQQILENNTSFGTIRNQINGNFTELYNNGGSSEDGVEIVVVKREPTDEELISALNKFKKEGALLLFEMYNSEFSKTRYVVLDVRYELKQGSTTEIDFAELTYIWSSQPYIARYSNAYRVDGKLSPNFEVATNLFSTYPLYKKDNNTYEVLNTMTLDGLRRQVAKDKIPIFKKINNNKISTCIKADISGTDIKLHYIDHDDINGDIFYCIDRLYEGNDDLNAECETTKYKLTATLQS